MKEPRPLWKHMLLWSIDHERQAAVNGDALAKRRRIAARLAEVQKRTAVGPCLVITAIDYETGTVTAEARNL